METNQTEIKAILTEKKEAQGINAGQEMNEAQERMEVDISEVKAAQTEMKVA